AVVAAAATVASQCVDSDGAGRDSGFVPGEGSATADGFGGSAGRAIVSAGPPEDSDAGRGAGSRADAAQPGGAFPALGVGKIPKKLKIVRCAFRAPCAWCAWRSCWGLKRRKDNAETQSARRKRREEKPEAGWLESKRYR